VREKYREKYKVLTMQWVQDENGDLIMKWSVRYLLDSVVPLTDFDLQIATQDYALGIDDFGVGANVLETMGNPPETRSLTGAMR
jgi:hypothetical protein